MRELLRRPGLDLRSVNLRLMNLPGYSPDFNAGEAVWGWAREETTGKPCLGSKAPVQEKADGCLSGLAHRKEEVRRRCRTLLQSKTEALLRHLRPGPRCQAITHPALALV